MDLFLIILFVFAVVLFGEFLDSFGNNKTRNNIISNRETDIISELVMSSGLLNGLTNAYILDILIKENININTEGAYFKINDFIIKHFHKSLSPTDIKNDISEIEEILHSKIITDKILQRLLASRYLYSFIIAKHTLIFLMPTNEKKLKIKELELVIEEEKLIPQEILEDITFSNLEDIQIINPNKSINYIEDIRNNLNTISRVILEKFLVEKGFISSEYEPFNKCKI